MFFYTQLKSATATTIEHRWYQGDRMRRAVQLRIEANPGAGYRTYSRNTISSETPATGESSCEVRMAPCSTKSASQSGSRHEITKVTGSQVRCDGEARPQEVLTPASAR